MYTGGGGGGGVNPLTNNAKYSTKSSHDLSIKAFSFAPQGSVDSKNQ